MFPLYEKLNIIFPATLLVALLPFRTLWAQALLRSDLPALLLAVAVVWIFVPLLITRKSLQFYGDISIFAPPTPQPQPTLTRIRIVHIHFNQIATTQAHRAKDVKRESLQIATCHGNFNPLKITYTIYIYASGGGAVNGDLVVLARLSSVLFCDDNNNNGMAGKHATIVFNMFSGNIDSIINI